MIPASEVPFLRPLSRRQLVGLDTVAACVYALVVVALSVGRPGSGTETETVPAAVRLALVVAMGTPLAVRRLWPVPAFAASVGITSIAAWMGVVHESFVGAAFVLYLVAVVEDRPHRALTKLTVGIGASGIVLLVLAGTPASAGVDLGGFVVVAVVLAGSWTIGRAVREQRQLAERSSAALVERAVSEERLWIARDLHDIVAHGLSIIVVKAATANHVAAARPDEASRALRVIEATGRDALAEMRTLLGVLRTDRESEDGLPDRLGPAPGIADLPALVNRVKATGVPVELKLDDLPALPEGVSLAIYRIVQEALTNVVRHAAPSRCVIEVRASAGAILVDVVDEGTLSAPAPREADPRAGSPGHGIIGMRERTRALGGEFAAGPIPDHGFRVLASIPLPSLEPSATEGLTG